MNHLPASVIAAPAEEYLKSIGEAAFEVPAPTAHDVARLSNSEPWTVPAYRAAFQGLAGKFVDVLYPHTEAAAFALLGQFLAAFGSMIGRTAHQMAEASRHYSNLYICLVGDTSRSRKGSAWSQVLRVMAMVDPDWVSNCLPSGLSTGEGLIHHVRDPQDRPQSLVKPERRRRGQEPDAGVSDKRACVMATELASTLATMSRSGNTLSATLRDAWDRGDLRTMSKGSPEHATGAHVSIIAHITREELRRELTSTEAANGFANRFMWLGVQRSKTLPEGGALSEGDIARLASEVRERVERARAVTLMRRDDEARELWQTEYDRLTAGHAGLFGAVTSRAEAQVLRLSTLYALLDLSDIVKASHLASALSFWLYGEDSALRIFGDASGDPIADRIREAVVGVPGIALNEVGNLFSRHVSQGRVHAAIETLTRSGAINIRQEATTGRPVTRLYPGPE